LTVFRYAEPLGDLRITQKWCWKCECSMLWLRVLAFTKYRAAC